MHFMRFGLTNIFAYRPHFEHLIYMQTLLERGGHSTYFLTCDSSVDYCYTSGYKKKNKAIECAKCIAGGIRSYKVKNITPIKKCDIGLSESELDAMSLSSSCTLTRIESDTDIYLSQEAVDMRKKLHKPINDVFLSTINWINNNKLDAVICFNGRMDLTNAVIKACESLNIPYITHERTWFGNGILLNANANCLSLRSVHQLSLKFCDKPLTKHQALTAIKIAALRFLRENDFEWRIYNKEARVESLDKKYKILILPSSRNEFMGHAEWQSGWKSNTEALSDFIEYFDINKDDVLVRFHPNWAENIASVDGNKIVTHYERWTNQHGINYVSSSDSVDTYKLIEDSDIVVVNNSSSAVDSAILGKKVILLGQARYSNCSFVTTFLSKGDFEKQSDILEQKLDVDSLIRSALRYLYLEIARVPQYYDYAKFKTSTECDFFEGGNVDIIINMLKNNQIAASDQDHDVDDVDESRVIVQIRRKDWRQLSQYDYIPASEDEMPIKRMLLFRPIAFFRNFFKLGDRQS